MAWHLNYGSDDTRSAGDAAYLDRNEVMAAFRRNRVDHPEAHLRVTDPEGSLIRERINGGEWAISTPRKTGGSLALRAG